MSETDSNGSGSDHRKDGFWRRIRARLSRKSDGGLRESLEGAIESHAAQHPEEEVREDAKSMMLNIIEFAKLRVDDVMVPRVDIVAIDETASVLELLERFTDANHSRLPVYRESLDGITGMVHVKDFMRWMTAKGLRRRRLTKAEKAEAAEKAEKSDKPKATAPSLSLPAAELAQTVKQSGLHREVLFVPPSMPATDLLVKMQASHIHLAIVIDEYGGTDGLVSIEDLVEVIVGDISDEHDTDDEAMLTDEGTESYVADGRLELSRLEELVKIDLFTDEEEEADTLAGIIFELAGRVPARGEIIRHSSGLEFEILDSDPRRVKRVRINMKNINPPSGETGPGDSGG